MDRDQMMQAKDRLWAQWEEGYKAMGSPCDFCPDEELYHALVELDHALGLDPSDDGAWV